MIQVLAFSLYANAWVDVSEGTITVVIITCTTSCLLFFSWFPCARLAISLRYGAGPEKDPVASVLKRLCGPHYHL